MSSEVSSGKMEVSSQFARRSCVVSSFIGLAVFIALSYHSLLVACLGGAIATFLSISIILVAKLTAAGHPISAAISVYVLVAMATFCV